MSYTNVKSYSDHDLINRMKSLDSFIEIPFGWHIIAVRSEENNPETYDDKNYLFYGETCIDVMTCTTNSGLYGQNNFHRWNSKGVAVVKSDEIYYNTFQKSDGVIIRHHNGKMKCLRQIAPMLYYRDNNRNGIVEETGSIYYGNFSTNIHANSYKHKTGIWSWIIGRWSTGCNVINNLTKYYKMINKIPYNQKVTYTLLKEF